ncbi:hypothetical protein Tgr7_0414 [Thioalkalivibrio sulfidiphilus HL-EbGr7]|uniref:Uncharacterized protein n=1 Tax=Thioalkalivibrio sulfidiphilus (strain HL-EbGR7) TaxID=396588 RepID=B8GV01_THISH|nr:hypothetical protein [Thioalkalivibrio sulfidiphilus]ACL71512.1 hypothetical protein Tgr7_0414 [Thioalkalivibrio sulfidiphilus HL-EbGr7]
MSRIPANIEVTELPVERITMGERRRRHDLRKLLLVGSLMADQLLRYADDLDESSGGDPQRMERALAEAWQSQLERARRQARESIGECEWCGLVDHHLVHGICPACRARSVDA